MAYRYKYPRSAVTTDIMQDAIRKMHLIVECSKKEHNYQELCNLCHSLAYLYHSFAEKS